MARVHNVLLRSRKKVFDKLRGLFFPAGAAVRLLKQSSTADEFNELIYLDTDWFFEYSAFRQNFLLEIASDDDDIKTAVQGSTHLDLEGEIYIIQTGDTLPPMGTDVTWKLFCDRFPNRGQFESLY